MNFFPQELRHNTRMLTLSLSAVILLQLSSCKSDDPEPVPPSDGKQITAFSFATPAATGTIDNTTRAISIEVPIGTNVTALVPTITFSDKATISPASGVA